MKIKYIVNVRLPTIRAQGYAIMKMCEGFANAGSDVELIIPERKYSEIKENPFDYYRVKENFKINRIKSIDLLGPFFAFGWLFYWIDILSFLFFLWVRGVAMKDDIIYTRDFLLVLPFYFYKNLVLELHEIPHSTFLFKFLIKRPKLFFVLNSHIKNILISLGVSTEKIHIAPSGVDLDEFKILITKEEARKKIDLPQDKKIIVYTGHLYPWKGVDTLAKAAEKIPELMFVFVGGVSPQLEEFQKKFGGFPNIVIRPFQERNIMPLYNAVADVVVIPNSQYSDISAKYTSPLKLFEYMGSRKPIVVSDLPSMREVLDESTAVFAEADNPESFASAIRKVLEDDNLAKMLSKNAYEKVKRYAWSDRAKKILDIIKKNE